MPRKTTETVMVAVAINHKGEYVVKDASVKGRNELVKWGEQQGGVYDIHILEAKVPIPDPTNLKTIPAKISK